MQMFYGVEVVPGKLTSYTDLPSGAQLRLTQATLSLDAKAGERVGVSAGIIKGGPHVLICSLKEGTCESQSLDVVLDSYAEFKVIGNASVHLTGYLLPEHEKEDLVVNKEGEPEDSQRGTKAAEDLKATATHDHKHGLLGNADNSHKVFKDGQTHPSNVSFDLSGLPPHSSTEHIHDRMRPPTAQKEGVPRDVSWAVTPNTPQGDIGHQVDQALRNGSVAILTYIQNEKSFKICTTGPYLINRVPLLPIPEQHLSRTPPHPNSSGLWLTILGKLATPNTISLGPCNSVEFREDVYVMGNPQPGPNKDYIFMPVSELANVAAAVKGATMMASGANRSDGEEPVHKEETEAPSQDVPQCPPVRSTTSPAFGQEEGAIADISWVVTPNTSQRDTGHLVDNALRYGPVAILTHIQHQKKFHNCCTGPFCINREPLLLKPDLEQHLGRIPPDTYSSGQWITILRKHRANVRMPLDEPHESIHFGEDVYVLKNPRPTTNRAHIFLPVSELANVVTAAVKVT